MNAKLDRTPDGALMKCDECSRDFRGEAWQDWCAECHAEKERNSHLRKTWACLTCNSKFALGDLVIRAGQRANDPWPCPRCGNFTITPADGEVRETNEYHGEIGTLN